MKRICFLASVLVVALSVAAVTPASQAVYPTTKAVFYGERVDISRKWNICVGRTDGGVEVHLTQVIKPIENRPGEYVVVRQYRYADGTFIKQSLKRLKR